MLINTHTLNEVKNPEHHSILPMMTAIFIDGLGPNRQRIPDELVGIRETIQTKEKIFRLPLLPEDSSPSDLSIEYQREIARSPRIIPGGETEKRGGNQSSVRSLISGISHHFNNILMGIWGNITLVRSELDKTDPSYECAFQMEQLIGNSAFLIHMVLGYLGERRRSAKKIRLKQLISEMKKEFPDSIICEVDHWDFEKRLQWASRVQQPRMIAGSTARVLDVLLKGIDGHCRDLLQEKAKDQEILKRLNNIERLVVSGTAITDQLRFYSGEFNSKHKRIKLAPLVKRLAGDIALMHRSLDIHLNISSKLKTIHADKEKISWSIRHIMENACQAMPEGGRLEIAVSPLQEVPPGNRCCIQKGCDYMVVTIKDTGPGIPPKIRKHVFEPFFAYPKTYTRKGLGLAAVDGILKSHNGYLQMQIQKKSGSAFSIYIPVAGTAAQGQAIKAQRYI